LNQSSKKIVFGLISFFLFFSCFSQSAPKTDSLESLALKATDSARVKLLNELGALYAVQDPDKGVSVSSKARRLAEQIHYEYGEALAVNNLGSAYFSKSDHKAALEQYNLALKLTDTTKYFVLATKILTNIGNIYILTGDAEKSMEYFVKAQKFNEKANDKNLEMTIQFNIGNLYITQGKPQLARSYFMKVLSQHVKASDRFLMGAVCNSLGILDRDEKKYDAAIANFQRAITFYDPQNDKRYMAVSLLNIADSYVNQENFDEAKEYYESARQNSEAGGDKEGIAYVDLGLGNMYNKMGKYDQAVSYLITGLERMKELKLAPNERDAYELLATSYAKKNEFERAYYYMEKFSRLKDSLSNQQSNRQIAELQGRFENDKKEKLIELLKEKEKRQAGEIKQKQKVVYIVLGGLSVVSLLTLLVLYNYRQKRKANQELAVKNNEIEFQRELLSKKNVLITDSINYAKRIQDSVLPAHTILKNHFQESFVFYKPKDIVSGDFFWIYETAGSVYVAVVDCTGHGVPGAFMSIVGNNLLEKIIVEKRIDDPAKVLDELNITLINSLKQDASSNVRDGMDMALCVIDKLTLNVRYAGAKNSLYVIRRTKPGTAAELTELKADKISIGRGGDKKFNTQKLILNGGDWLYLFTDGFVDQKGGKEGGKFYYDSFRNLLLKINTEPAEKQKELLEQTITEWMDQREQMDDMLIAGIKI